jgi:hypothetical protein
MYFKYAYNYAFMLKILKENFLKLSVPDQPVRWKPSGFTYVETKLDKLFFFPVID